MSEPDKKCECGHFMSQHFQTQDSIGWWTFCMRKTCECFKEIKDEITGEPKRERP